MAINIKIENHYTGRYTKSVEKKIKSLLNSIPERYIRGINSILLLNSISYRNKKNASGIYVRETQSEPAHIELAIGNILKDMPGFIFHLPFVSKFILASVLYHEVGHHYQINKTGLKKKDWEDDAENFANRMLKRTFFIWLILAIPLAPLIKFLRKR